MSKGGKKEKEREPKDEVVQQKEVEKKVEEKGKIKKEAEVLLTKDIVKKVKESYYQTLSDKGDESVMSFSGTVNKRELKELQKIADIGALNAAKSLTMMIGKEVSIDIPEVEVVDIRKAPEITNTLDEIAISVLLGFEGDLKGDLIFSMPQKEALSLISNLLGMELSELTPDGKSAIMELVNVVGTSVLNVIANKLRFIVVPKVPEFAYDYLYATLTSILLKHSIKSNDVFLLKTRFYYEDEIILANLLFIPEDDSARKLVERLKQGQNSEEVS